jgi:hypothetical protein
MSLNSSKTILNHTRFQRIANSEQNHFQKSQMEYRYLPLINLSKAQRRRHHVDIFYYNSLDN